MLEVKMSEAVAQIGKSAPARPISCWPCGRRVTRLAQPFKTAFKIAEPSVLHGVPNKRGDDRRVPGNQGRDPRWGLGRHLRHSSCGRGDPNRRPCSRPCNGPPRIRDRPGAPSTSRSCSVTRSLRQSIACTAPTSAHCSRTHASTLASLFSSSATASQKSSSFLISSSFPMPGASLGRG